MDNQELNTHFIKVIGHRNPDTDSVCSAIAYSRLKNTLDPEHPCKPCRAGLLNRETEFVLNYFQVPDPQLYTDVSPQIRDVDIRRMEGVDGEMSLRRAWITMRDQQIDTLCVVDKERNLKGLITVKDVATANMDVLDTYILAESETSYQNIVDILDAKVLVGDITGKKVEGRIVIGSGSAEQMERSISKGDIVIVANRSESQLTAIEMGAGCVVVCAGCKVSRTICMLAEEQGCMIISTPNSTYVSGQMISQAAPIRHYMVRDDLLTFNLNSSVESATKVMASVRFRYFPVLDDDGHYIGVVSRRNMMNLHKKQLILVDHNEKGQAVEGIDRRRSWRSSTTTASAPWRQTARSISAMCRLGAPAPSSIRCTGRTGWSWTGPPPGCCSPPSFRTPSCSAVPPAPPWMSRRAGSWPN